MHKFLIGVFPLVFLVGCSCEAPVQRATQPCFFKDQKLCRDREVLQIKSDLFLAAVQKFDDCIWRQSRTGLNACGKRPEWKDFK